MENGNNKISESEMIVIGGFMLFVDLFCAAVDTSLAGAFITPPVQSAVTLGASWWFSQKGDGNAFKLGKQLAKHAANVVPWLPTLTVAFAVDVYILNHPAVAQVAGKVVGKIEPAAGGAIKKAA